MNTVQTKVLLLLFVTTINSSAQEWTQSKVDELKQRGTLPYNFSKKNPGAATRVMPRLFPPNEIMSGNTCDCLIPLDSTFSVGQFDYQGGSGGPGVPPDYRNDDWSTPAIQLPFSFCYFGQNINSIYINNNGSISFNSTFSAFTSDSFPDTSFMMIAPFWGDVDTRAAGSGLVYYKVTATHLIVRWDHVGYYGLHDDKLNTFQLIITDGIDSIVPGGNTSFCYGDMQWTTGDASNGSGGFGGIPSTVGANLGDGANFIQFGRFDQPGYGYDGPYLSNDSVDWLDSSNFVFDLCPVNVPPIALDCIADTIFMRVGDTVDVDISFIAPEMGQSINITVNAGGLNNFVTLMNTSGDFARYRGQLIADASNLGFNSIFVSATDNGNPPETTNVDRIINIDLQTGLNLRDQNRFLLYPNPCAQGEMLQFSSSAGAELSIFNLLGKELFHSAKDALKVFIDKELLGKGMFIYNIRTSSGIKETGKLILY